MGEVVTLAGLIKGLAILGLYPRRPGSQLFYGNSGVVQITGGSTKFMVAAMSAEETEVYIPIPRAGTFRNLSFVSSGSPGAGQTYTATLRNTLADTALTCQIPAGSNTATDTNHTVHFSAGQRMAVKFAASADAAATNILWSMEFVPDPAP